MRRLVYRLGAVMSFALGLALLLWVGLPNPRDYQGEWLQGVGWIAPAVGAIAPPFERPNLAGETVRLADWRGQTVIVNFWATWCAPCLAEMPELQAFYTTTNIPVLGVNVGESAQAVQAWVNELGITFPIMLDTQSRLEVLYQLRGLPMTFIIGPDGVVQYIFYGPIQASELITHIN